MKKQFLTLTSFILLSTSAFAGTTPCAQPAKVLTCSSSYQLVRNYGSTSVAGPTAQGKVEDQQPEPFDPSECQASAVLFTYVGRFVLTYTENTKSVYAWLETDGKTKVLVTDQALTSESPVSITVKSPLAGIVDSATFNCTLK